MALVPLACRKMRLNVVVFWMKSQKPRSRVIVLIYKYGTQLLGAKESPNVAAFHRQWWRPYMSKMFWNRTKDKIDI